MTTVRDSNDSDRSSGKRLSIDDILVRVRSELAQRPLERPDQVVAGVKRKARKDEVHVTPLPDPNAGGPEPGRARYAIEDFAGLDETSLVRAAYRVILGREIDRTGEASYLAGLKSGRLSIVSVLGALRWSAEGRKRKVQIDRLFFKFVLDSLRKVRVIGPAFSPIAEVLMLPATVRQLNQRIAATNDRHRELISHLERAHGALRRSLMHFDDSLIRLDEEGADMRHIIDDGLLSEIAAARTAVREESRTLFQAIGELKADPARQEVDMLEPERDHALDSLYVAFENKFRGSTAEITDKVRRYLPMFSALPPVAAGDPVLDIGCGRGEWLSVLADANITVRGVDLNVAMVEEARQRGHDVVAGDAIAYLRAQAQNSLAAVTGFHIVEHLSFPQLIDLLDAAFAAVKPGGAILFETPNPENLVVGACTFNYDPTHNKPLPPDLLRFLAEARGFAEGRIVRNEADCRLDQPETGFAPQEVNDWFRQPLDYAVFATKPEDAGHA